MDAEPQAGVFPPLESDPSLFNTLIRKLGASPSLHFEDVLSLNSAHPNTLALLLISSSISPSAPSTPEAADGVVWLQQTLPNTCGFYALLHGICNLPEYITPGSFFNTVVKAGSREERQRVLENSTELRDVYLQVAVKGQTKVEGVDPGFHYSVFLRKNGRNWELGGGHMGPVDRGAGGELLEVVKRRIETQKGGYHGLMALVKE